MSSHRGKPVVLALVYYRCPSSATWCLGSLARSLRELGLKLGKDYGRSP